MLTYLHYAKMCLLGDIGSYILLHFFDSSSKREENIEIASHSDMDFICKAAFSRKTTLRGVYPDEKLVKTCHRRWQFVKIGIFLNCL